MKRKIEKMRKRLSQNQLNVSHLSEACSSSNNRRRPHNTRVMRYFKEFKPPRFKSSILILFKWGSVPVRFLLWKKEEGL
jgi:ribosomal protein L32